MGDDRSHRGQGAKFRLHEAGRLNLESRLSLTHEKVRGLVTSVWPAGHEVVLVSAFALREAVSSLATKFALSAR